MIKKKKKLHQVDGTTAGEGSAAAAVSKRSERRDWSLLASIAPESQSTQSPARNFEALGLQLLGTAKDPGKHLTPMFAQAHRCCPSFPPTSFLLRLVLSIACLLCLIARKTPRLLIGPLRK